MLRSLKDLERYKVSATDGDLGSVVNFLLDDEHWAIRYLIVDTGGFLGGRNVLISPISFGEVSWSDRHFHLALTKDRIKNGPSVDLAKPVSRQHEYEYNDYYGYPYYWGSSWLWGVGAMPVAMPMGRFRDERPLHAAARAAQSDDDVHLRSVNELRGYHIHGTDGAIGHVDDFIVDDVTWRLPYLVIDTSNWWVGHKVLVAPQWASRIDWAARNVHVDMSRERIKSSPAWVPEAPINREYEERLYDFYGRPVYWVGEARPLPSAHYASRTHP
jgi:hypothetical protein